jgi:hypothetical protein
MALVPNKFESTEIDLPADTDDFTETMKRMSIENGYYQAKGVGGSTSSRSDSSEDVLLESKKTILNQYGTAMRQDSESWVYEVYKGPPLEYHRETRSNCYLPKQGRIFRKVEEETIVYWTFSPLTDGDNLGRTRFLSAFVIYDLPVITTEPVSAEAKAKTEEKGMKAGDTQDRIVSSGKLWSEANNESRVVEDENANQVAIWVENVIIEHDIVEEEADKWTIWTIKKNSLRPGQVDVDGPRHIKKTGFTYQFPVELTAPKLVAKSSALGVTVTVTGGGAEYKNKWFNETIYIVPDLYNIYRAKIAEPPRDPSGDNEDFWDPDPAPEERRKVIGTGSTTDQAGAPADPLPPSAGHTEPGDIDEPDPPEEVNFTMIGTVENDNKRQWRDKGHAVFVDLDVETLGEYEYYAEAVVNEQVSPESNHEIVTYLGGKSRSHRLGFRSNDDGSIEIDADAPDDPGVPPPDYGGVVDFTPPAAIDPEDVEPFIEDIAPRKFATNEPDINVNLDVLMPLLGLEYGQAVQMPEVLWETYGNQLIMSQGTLPERWTLVGFSMGFERDRSGGWTSQRTTLNLRRRAGR